MIFFEGYQQQYRVEELTSQQAARLLTQQLHTKEETKETAHDIMSRFYSYRSNSEVKK